MEVIQCLLTKVPNICHRSSNQKAFFWMQSSNKTGDQYSTCRELLLILFSKTLKCCQKQFRNLKWDSIVQSHDDFQSLWKYVSLLFHNLGIISANCRKFIVSTLSATLGNWFQELPEIFLIYDFRPIMGNYFQCMIALSEFHINCIGRSSVVVMVVVFK